MTITPDQAQTLLDGATPGPWRALHDQWEDEDGTPCEDFYVLGGPDGILHTEDFDPDTHNPVANTTLAAAAPDMAQTIAGMTVQYGIDRDVKYATGGRRILWFKTEAEARKEWGRDDIADVHPRLVRRLVSAPEVINGE